MVLFDDILVYSVIREHKRHLLKIMNLSPEQSFVVYPKKSAWSPTKVEHLGHAISWSFTLRTAENTL